MGSLGFYAQLRPGLPGLEPVHAAVAARDLETAESAYAAFLRKREWDLAVLAPAAAVELGEERHAEADAIVEGRITLIGRTVAFDGAIDWKHAPEGLPDWPLMLNRHSHWKLLAEAFHATGNPVYATAFCRQLAGWLKEMPPPNADLMAQGRCISREQGHKRPFAPGWRTIETGERLRDSWPAVFGAFVRQPAVPDRALVAMAASMVRQADFLCEFVGPQNWMYIECEGLLTVSGIFPEFRRSAQWAKVALERVEQAVSMEIYPSGAHEELTFWYHEVVRKSLAGIMNKATAQGLAVPEIFRDRLQAMYASALKAMQPDGLLPQVNDGDRLPAAPILKDAARRFGRGDFLHAATQAKDGPPPPFQSVCLPEAGWAIMRSGWEPNAGYAFFDAGPFGGHAHEDKLSIILHAHGSPFIIDTGRSAYGDDPWRRFNIGPWAHSTVLFDDSGQCRRWWPGHRLMRSTGAVAQGFRFSASPTVDIAAGAFGEIPEEFYHEAGKGFRFVVHRRTLLFLKPDRWVIIDRFSPRDDHPAVYGEADWDGPIAPARATALFQLADHPLKLERERSRLVLGHPDGPRMTFAWTGQTALAPSVHRGQAQPRLLGWRFADMDDGHRPIPVPTLSLECPLPQLPHLQACLVSVAPSGQPVRNESIHLARQGDTLVLEVRGSQGIAFRCKADPAPDAPLC